MSLCRVFLLQALRRSTTIPTKSAATTRTTTFTRTLFYLYADAACRRRRRQQGQHPEFTPEARSLHERVGAAIEGGDLDVASAIAREAVDSDTRPALQTCNFIMYSMHSAGRYEDVVQLFNFFFKQSNIKPTIYSYTLLIKSYIESGRIDEALQVNLSNILDHFRLPTELPRFSRTPCIYNLLTKGLISANRISEALALLREMLAKDVTADSLVYNNLISGFLELNQLQQAQDLFAELLLQTHRSTLQDGVIYATFMEHYFKHDMEKQAMESYQSLLDRNSIMCIDTNNVLLKVLLKYGKTIEANALFHNMLNAHTHHMPPICGAINSETFNIMVNDCFRLGKISEALLIFQNRGSPPAVPFDMSVVGYNNIIGKLCDIGMVEEADKLFDEMRGNSVMPDVSTFRILFDAYFKQDRIQDVLKWFNYLLFETYFEPSCAFVHSVFTGLTTKGRIDEAAEILMRMPERDQKPFPTCYELVLTQLCNRGKLDRVHELLGLMATYNIGVVTPPKLCALLLDAFRNDNDNHQKIENQSESSLAK